MTSKPLEVERIVKKWNRQEQQWVEFRRGSVRVVKHGQFYIEQGPCPHSYDLTGRETAKSRGTLPLYLYQLVIEGK